MRFALAALLGLLASGLGLVLQDDGPPVTCRLTLELVDAENNRPVPGVVQLLDAEGKLLEIEALLNRGQGLTKPEAIRRWWVLPERAVLEVPAAAITVRALAGLETELAEAKLDLTGKSKAELKLPLKHFHRARESGYVAGNTHLHLMKLSKPQSDRYLQTMPLVDGLDIVFVSYLERAKADLEYTTNNYTPEDLQRLSTDHVHFGHGEEHRHNFGPGGEGYGHILLLDIPYIVRPVSIGPGITLAGHDAPPLQQGIDEARRAGGKVIWAHNLFGHEDIPNWLTGRVHANNIFDGGTRGSYQGSLDRYLNVGLKVPFSTGTDWFLYDFSRVYVMTNQAVTPRQWLDLLSAGKTYITNGPLLELTVDGQPIGATLEIGEPREVTVQARAIGRIDFQRLELVQNGRVVAQAKSQAKWGHFSAELSERLPIDAACWLAVRTPPPPAPDDPELQAPVPENEYGGALFAHSSPIYVNFAGQGVFDRATAEKLVAEMQASMVRIEEQASFADERQRRQVLDVYREGIERLRQRMAKP